MIVRFFKKHKRNFILGILIAYLIHVVPIYLQKNSFVFIDNQPNEITFIK